MVKRLCRVAPALLFLECAFATTLWPYPSMLHDNHVRCCRQRVWGERMTCNMSRPTDEPPGAGPVCIHVFCFSYFCREAGQGAVLGRSTFTLLRLFLVLSQTCMQCSCPLHFFVCKSCRNAAQRVTRLGDHGST